LVYALYKNGYTTLYARINDYGWLYFFISLMMMIILHDTYFYWTHRMLHKKWMFKKFHKVHHQSVNPTPLSAYAFHPIEVFVESLVVFPFITIFPVHIFAFTFFTFIVLFINVVGHLGYEFVPFLKRKHPFVQLFTSSTHHNLHHQKTHKKFWILLYFLG